MSEDVEDAGSFLTADLDVFLEQMHMQVPGEQSVYTFFMSAYMKNCLDTYQARYEKRLRWFTHCVKVYHLPSRKLRKCYMRKVERRRQRERGRYL